MKNFSKKDIKILFSGLCCSRCKNEFTKDSIKIIDRDSDVMVCSLSCEKCCKDFGEIVFNYDRKSKNHSPLEIIEGPPPISYDDVIDAHKFFKNL